MHKQSAHTYPTITSTKISTFAEKDGAMPFFQPKLTFNTPGDAHEQEADAVAYQMIRMKERDVPVTQRMPLTAVPGVQRGCAHCEEEEQHVQRKTNDGGDAGGKVAPTVINDVLSSGNCQPMDGTTRQFMESRFGQDFSGVRIHTDSRAAESAAAIQARAYTSGRDVVFGAGEYQPASEGGKRLLAHELVHVRQQGGVSDKIIQRQEMTPRQIRRDEHLRALATWPSDAHREWRRLREGERSVVILYMAIRYGEDFASDFHRITQLRRRPAPVAHYTNILTETHQQLRDRGYRLAGITMGIEQWVHPSGNSINRVLPSRRGGTSQEPELTQTPEDDRQERCADPCLDSTSDNDSCHICCDTTIPESDPHCRTACHFACAIDLNL